MFTNEDWRDRAACKDKEPELFFPIAGESTPTGCAQYAQAKAVCSQCPVAAECLEYALDVGLDHGVFGGTTPKERRALVKRQRVATST